MGLRQKTFSGLVWSFSEQIGSKIIQFVIGIILARLLLPEEFGLIGMITIFLAISESISAGGFVQALIRKPDCTDEDYNTAFIYNFIVSIFLYGLIYFLAPSIASFFDESSLNDIIRVLFIIIIIDAIAFVQRAKLFKHLNFKVTTYASIISNLVSGILGVLAAYQGYGVWSLVLKMVINRLIIMLFLVIASRWMPHLSFSIASFKELFGFGSKLLVNQVVERTYKNVYAVVIGKFFSASDLGYFTRASLFRNLVSEQLVTTFQQVTLPVLSSMQQNEESLERNFKKLTRLVLFISSFFLIGMIPMAKPMVLFLVGQKWEQSILYLQLLAIAGILYPLGEINLNILQVKGRSNYILKLNVIKKAFSVPLIILGVIFGIKYLIIGIIVSSIFEFFANSYYSKRMINYSSIEQLLYSSRYISIISTTALATYFLALLLNPVPYGLVLLIQILFYVAVNLVIFELIKNEEYIEIKNILAESVLRKIFPQGRK